MTLQQIKQKVSDNYLKSGVALSMGMMSVPAMAQEADVNLNIDVSEIESALEKVQKPIAAVASASLGAYVVIRAWKLVRKAI